MVMIDVLSKVFPLSDDSKERLTSITVEREYPRGQHLLNLWQVPTHFHFIVQGAGRVYYLRDGLDITDYMALDMQFLGGVPALFTREPSHKAIEVLEQSRIQSIDFAAFQRLCEQYLDICNVGRLLAGIGFLEGQQRIEDMRFLSAGERYEKLLEKYPGITNRIALKHIASYLGTTPVSLSRIRAGSQ